MSEQDTAGDTLVTPGESGAQQLLQGLQQQRSIYSVLQRLTEQQCEVMLSGETEELLMLANSKDAELLRIESINEQIGELKASWRQWCDGVPSALKELIDQEMSSLSDLLHTLIELDRKAEESYRSQQQACVENLRKAEGSRRVKQAYGKQAPVVRPALDSSH